MKHLLGEPYSLLPYKGSLWLAPLLPLASSTTPALLSRVRDTCARGSDPRPLAVLADPDPLAHAWVGYASPRTRGPTPTKSVGGPVFSGV